MDVAFLGMQRSLGVLSWDYRSLGKSLSLGGSGNLTHILLILISR